METLKCAYDSPNCEGEVKKYTLILDDTVTLCNVHAVGYRGIIKEGF